MKFRNTPLLAAGIGNSRILIFIRNTVGEQLVRTADSIGANIAEGYGRYHYGEKLRFLYFARGSLYETKYWLNRCSKRNLMAKASTQKYNEQLNGLARQINAFAASLKSQKSAPDQVRETELLYAPETFEDSLLTSFNES